MEVSVSFTDGNTAPAIGDYVTAPDSFTLEETVMGRAWIQTDRLILTPPVRVRYEKHPWMEKFEFDGIRPAPAKRTGIGTKDAKGFVRSLSTIYSDAYSDYREYGGDGNFDVSGYFGHAARRFAEMAEDDDRTIMVRKFCGFTENMWREGNQEMLDVCVNTVIPAMEGSPGLKSIFSETVTEEFRDWLACNC